ncbi:hypothetical protein HNR19_002948 [Nocardioides thalensis]|uniref:Uncharacterized protein n=1 Tax=Nocardioides thalensis TaxID=1914755 RepID=A0A853C225_9ACTN|nr:hypothetical protein [Nocardioides thalensis]NYJ02250.1 hypothetical protein [Nocardioides thalensis]
MLAVYAGGLVYRESLPRIRGRQAGSGSSPVDDARPEEECPFCRKVAISMVTVHPLSTGDTTRR